MQSIAHPQASNQVVGQQVSSSASKASSPPWRELVDDAGILNLLHLPVVVHRLPSDPPSRQQATLGTHSLRSRAGAVGVRPVYQTLEWRPRHRGWSRTPSDGVQVCGPQRTAGLTRAVRGSQSTGLRHSQVAPSNPCNGRNYNGKFSCAVNPEASSQPMVLSGYLHLPSLP